MNKNKEKIKAINKTHLRELIKNEIIKNGLSCNLNHIDTSEIVDMSDLFYKSSFNGDISQWDTSKVIDMSYMFCNSLFDNDISDWNTSCVKSMENMFEGAQFSGDISDWKPTALRYSEDMFSYSCAPVPYWAKTKTLQERVVSIEIYNTSKALEKTLNKKFKKANLSKL